MAGPDATPQIGGVSLSAWLVLAGGLTLVAFGGWLLWRSGRGRSALVDPALFGVRQLMVGLGIIHMQYLVKTGLFFAIPLFLSIVLGFDAFETGLRMLPISIALVVTAPAITRFAPGASVRSVVVIGLLFLLAASTVLAAGLEVRAGPWVTLLPFVFIGIGLGAVASQLGNVIISAVPLDRGSEAGGLQHTAVNLGAALGTAIAGSVVIASLTSLIAAGIVGSPELDDAVRRQAEIRIDAGVDFVPVDEVADALAETSLPRSQQEAINDTYATAQLGALSRTMILLSLALALTLVLALGLPKRSLVRSEVGD
jgi:hypothetical protein